MYFLHQSLLVIIFVSTTKAALSNPCLIVQDSGIEEINQESPVLKFFVLLNNTSHQDDFTAEVHPDECCLQTAEEIDCNILDLIGVKDIIIPTESTRKIELITPIDSPYNRKGYCIAYLDSQDEGKKGDIMRDVVRINFDTKVKSNTSELQSCKNIDEDPANDCKPVDCAAHYNGKKTHHSTKTKRCEPPVTCVTKNAAYDPRFNKCKSIDVTKRDLKSLKTNKTKRKTRKKNRKAKDLFIIENYPKETIMQVNPLETVNRNSSLSVLGNCFHNKLCYLTVISVMGVLQIVLLAVLVYCLLNRCKCCSQKKEAVRSLFSYRQDASDTTPLIYTSNMEETETTDFQCQSESSNNMVKKIQYYKSIQDKSNGNIKKSMSDDVLSKCLNRRDWCRQPIKTPEAIKEVNDAVKVQEHNTTGISTSQKTESNKQNNRGHSIDNKSHLIPVMNSCECDETEKLLDRVQNLIDGKRANVRSEIWDDNDDIDLKHDSEMELKCHSFKSQHKVISNHTKDSRFQSRSAVLEFERSAQIKISSDSIDELIAEKSRMYGVGVTPPLTSCSEGAGVASDESGKTSKNNVRQKLSTLFRRKTGPMSDSDSLCQ